MIDFPEKLQPLFEPHRFKVLYGGRDAMKSWSIARALLIQGTMQQERILCTREVQKTIADSVHQLLCDQIANLNVGAYYDVLDNYITGKNGTEFMFAGLHQQTVDNLKSYEGVTKAWVEEAHKTTKRSWNVLEPTIRRDGSEIWASFNPDMDSDFIYQYFVANKPPDGSFVLKVTWRDNPWPSKVLETAREKMRREDPEEYEHIYEGRCNTVVPGAVYAKEVVAMIEGRRARPMPYDPGMPVHTIWDLGWNDAMSIILVQRIVSAVMVIGYLEASGKTYADCVAELNTLKYVWGTDWLPHDGAHTRPDTGKNPKQLLEKLGRKRVVIMPKLDPEHGIKAVRMMFPRLYIDNSEFENDTWEYDGGARLIECLKRYRRAVPTTTGEPAKPVHDEFSHGADAVRGLATIVDKIRNDDRTPTVPMPAPELRDPGMGMMG